MTPPLPITLTLVKLDDVATFMTYLRLEPTDPAAEGFGLEGAVLVSTTTSRDSWEGLGMPTVLAVTLSTVEQLREVQA